MSSQKKKRMMKKNLRKQRHLELEIFPEDLQSENGDFIVRRMCHSEAGALSVWQLEATREGIPVQLQSL